MKQLKSKSKNYDEYLIESFDDLWVLSKYLQHNDVIFSKTQRKVAIGSGEKTKQTTKIIVVELRVQRVELQSNQLRVSGEIINENEFVSVGSHHSLSYEIGDSIEINNSNTAPTKPEYVHSLLNNALKSTKHKFLIILCDVDSIIVSKCSLYSLDIIIEQSRIGSKKYFSTQKQISGVEEMALILQDIQLQEYQFIVFAGPGNYKTDLKQLVEKQFSNLQTYIVSTIDAERSTLTTVIDYLKEHSIIEENENVELSKKINDFMQKLHNNSQLVSYGEDSVISSIEQGAVDIAIFSEEKYDEMHERNLNSLLLLEKMKGDVSIVPRSSKYHSIINGLGGIIALLRF
ncbi:MAG: hypothetical protein ACLFPL_02235 [Candidatus Nanoarchaeia archaeon]